MERIKKTIKKIKRWKTILKVLKVISKVWGIFIAIIGPVMSIYLMVDGVLNKEEKPEKQPVEAIKVEF